MYEIFGTLSSVPFLYSLIVFHHLKTHQPYPIAQRLKPLFAPIHLPHNLNCCFNPFTFEAYSCSGIYVKILITKQYLNKYFIESYCSS